MEKLLDSTIEYLDRVENQRYKAFMNSSYTEVAIPETAKAIKNLVLRESAIVLATNRHLQYKVVPKLGRIDAISSEYTIIDYEDYFANEQICLMYMRKLLKSKLTTINEFPINSLCGILLEAIMCSNIENQKKLTSIFNAADCNIAPCSVIIPSEWEKPSNAALIKKMSYDLKNKYNER